MSERSIKQKALANDSNEAPEVGVYHGTNIIAKEGYEIQGVRMSIHGVDDTRYEDMLALGWMPIERVRIQKHISNELIRDPFAKKYATKGDLVYMERAKFYNDLDRQETRQRYKDQMNGFRYTKDREGIKPFEIPTVTRVISHEEN